MGDEQRGRRRDANGGAGAADGPERGARRQAADGGARERERDEAEGKVEEVDEAAAVDPAVGGGR